MKLSTQIQGTISSVNDSVTGDSDGNAVTDTINNGGNAVNDTTDENIVHLGIDDVLEYCRGNSDTTIGWYLKLE